MNTDQTRIRKIHLSLSVFDPCSSVANNGAKMDKITVADARRVESIGRKVLLRGWVRTRRGSKGGFSFIELNDGSCQGNVQVVAPGELANYEKVVKHLHTGASVTVEGEVKASPAKGQATEVHASMVDLVGDADP